MLGKAHVNIDPCPCCGQSWPASTKHDVKRLIASNNFTGMERRILECFAGRFGQWITATTIANTVYACDPNGGPLNAENSINVLIHRMRPKLVGFPLALETRNRVGRRMVWNT